MDSGDSLRANFVAGRPITDIWGARLAWRCSLEAAMTAPIHHPNLTFIRNDRSDCDLDNLAYPVLAVSGCATCESIWATVTGGPVEGVWIINEVTPPPPPAEAVSI